MTLENLQQIIDANVQLRSTLRKLAGARYPYPIKIEEGNTAPHLIGEKAHHETRGGTYVRHPSAYRTVGWSNLVYVASTREVAVGADWLQQRKETENAVS